MQQTKIEPNTSTLTQTNPSKNAIDCEEDFRFIRQLRRAAIEMTLSGIRQEIVDYLEESYLFAACKMNITPKKIRIFAK